MRRDSAAVIVSEGVREGGMGMCESAKRYRATRIRLKKILGPKKDREEELPGKRRYTGAYIHPTRTH
jgi:hypothetical protein